MAKKSVKRPATKQQKRYERAKRKARYGRSWDEVRMLVYKRDGFRCRACGRAKGEGNVRKLNAHHILLLRVSQTNDPRNLVTLCDECHREVENKGLRLLKAGGHRRDVVRMTHRWLVEKRAQATQKLMVEMNGERSVSSNTESNQANTGPNNSRDS